jgi:hypothetical protein
MPCHAQRSCHAVCEARHSTQPSALRLVRRLRRRSNRPLRFTALRFTALRFTALRFTALRFTALRSFTMQR